MLKCSMITQDSYANICFSLDIAQHPEARDHFLCARSPKDVAMGRRSMCPRSPKLMGASVAGTQVRAIPLSAAAAAGNYARRPGLRSVRGLG